MYSSVQMTLASANETKKSKDEITVIPRRFGDEQSTLLDRYERLSFEVQLNQAMLGRSLSEPSAATRFQFRAPPAPQPLVPTQVRQGCRVSGLNKVLKNFLKPIFGRRKGNSGRKQVNPDPRDPKNWKAFSRSLRF